MLKYVKSVSSFISSAHFGCQREELQQQLVRRTEAKIGDSDSMAGRSVFSRVPEASTTVATNSLKSQMALADQPSRASVGVSGRPATEAHWEFPSIEGGDSKRIFLPHLAGGPLGSAGIRWLGLVGGVLENVVALLKSWN